MPKLRCGIALAGADFASEGGVRCPYCKSEDVHPSQRFSEGEDGTVRRKVRCYNCGNAYQEVYRLKTWERCGAA